MDKPQIKLTKPGESDYEEFLSFPAHIYEPGSIRLSQGENIDEEHLHTCIMLYRNGEMHGRLALYNNPDLIYAGKKALAVGNYESIDDNFSAQALMLYAIGLARKLGAEWLIGPMNGSTWNRYRFCTDRPESYFFTEYQHKDYYTDQFILSGFREIARYYSQVDTRLQHEQAGLEKWSRINRENGIRIRNIDLDNFEIELKKLHRFTTEVFSSNFLYTPISEEAFLRNYMALKEKIDPDFLMLAEKDKELAGLFFSIPDFYDKAGETLVVKTIARKKDRQYAGIIREMASLSVKRAADKGYKKMIHAFMHEDNDSRSVSGRYCGDLLKTYILLAMKL